MAPVLKCFNTHNDEYKTKVVVTAQHRVMLDQVLNLFEIDPDYDLNIMQVDQDLFDVTSNIMSGMKNIIEYEICWAPGGSCSSSWPIITDPSGYLAEIHMSSALIISY